MKTQLTFSKHPEISKEYFTSPRNYAVKPWGGLWSSTYTPNSEYLSSWHEFCSIEYEGGISHNTHKIIFDISNEARIYTIDSQNDLIKLIQEVGYYYDESGRVMVKMGRKPYGVWIDFEQAKNYYDVIHLTERGQWTTRIPYENGEYHLYGWDIECSLILNYNVIQNQRGLYNGL